MGNPYSPPSVPASFNANPPSDDGSQTTANTISWNGASGTSGILAKIGTPLKQWIDAINSGLVTAFGLVAQGPASATAGNIVTFADSSGGLLQDSGVSATGLLPAGSIVSYGGLSAPAGWLLCFGQAVTRTGGNANLFSAITLQTTGNTHTTTTIDGIPSTANMAVGMPISGSGIQAGTTIASIVSGSSITLSLATTTSANNVAIVVAPYGVGDGSTTFNVPDFRGRAPFGADAMGGSAANVLGSGATGGITTAAIVGAKGGEQKHGLITAELAVHNHGASGSGSFTAFTSASSGDGSGGQGVIQTPLVPSPTPVSQAVSVSVSTNNAGTGTAHNTTPPAIVTNFIIKL